MRRYAVVVAGLIAAFAVYAGSAEDVLKRYSGFLDKLSTEQRDQIMSKAKEVLDKRAKERSDQRSKTSKQAAKMSLNLIKELYKKGETAYKEGDFPAAYSYFRMVGESTVTGAESLREKSRERLAEMEAEAIARYDEADVRFRQGNYVKSALLLGEIEDAYPYTSVADKARSMLRKLTARPEAAAAVLYGRGRQHEDAEDYARAVNIYKEASEKYPEEWDGMRAKIRLDKLLSEPEVIEALRRAREFEAADEAPRLINLARNYLFNEQYDRAAEKLRELIGRFPDSAEGKAAKEALVAGEAGNWPEAQLILDKSRYVEGETTAE